MCLSFFVVYVKCVELCKFINVFVKLIWFSCGCLYCYICVGIMFRNKMYRNVFMLFEFMIYYLYVNI